MSDILEKLNRRREAKRDSIARTVCEDIEVKPIDDGPSEYNMYRDGYNKGFNTLAPLMVKLIDALRSSSSHSFYCPYSESKGLNQIPEDCDACDALAEFEKFCTETGAVND